MLRMASYDIVFQEIPGEVTLAVNISGCPNRCRGCHSPYLWQETGEVLDEVSLSALLSSYGDSITCVAFMGGDAEPETVQRLAEFVRQYHKNTEDTTAGKTPDTDTKPRSHSGAEREPDTESTAVSDSSLQAKRNSGAMIDADTCFRGHKDISRKPLKTAWYSGRADPPEGLDPACFNYIKLGEYIPELGGLGSPTTNQKFYRIEVGLFIDRTDLFRTIK